MKRYFQGKSNASIDMVSTKKNKDFNAEKSEAFVEKEMNVALSSEKTNVKSLAQNSQLEINFPRGNRKFNTLGNASNSVFKKRQAVFNIFDQSTMPKEREQDSGEKNHGKQFNQRVKLSEEQKEERAKRKRERNKERKLNNKFKTKEEYQQKPSEHVLVKARLALNSMLMNSEDNLKRAPVQDVDKIAADFKKLVSGKGMKTSKLKNSEYEGKLSKKSAVLNKFSKKQRIVDTNKFENLDNKDKKSSGSKAKSPKTAGSSTSKPAFGDEENSRTLFVGNLPITMDRHDLRQLFRNNGFDAQAARIRNVIPSKGSLTKKVAIITQRYHKNVTSLNGYVVFSSNEEAIKGLAMNQQEVESHHITVNFADETEDKGDQSIFLGGLPFEIEDETLWKTFSVFGKIKAIRVIRDKETGIGRGIGYVSFEDKKSVNEALKMNVIVMEDRKVYIHRCVSDKTNQPKRRKRRNLRNKPDQSNTTDRSFAPYLSNAPNQNAFKSVAIKQKRLEKESSKKSIKKRVKQLKNKQKKKKISSLFDKN